MCCNVIKILEPTNRLTLFSICPISCLLVPVKQTPDCGEQ